jgi:hypothetical protein
VHALDEGIGRDRHLFARTQPQQRGVVTDPERDPGRPAGGDPLDARDQLELVAVPQHTCAVYAARRRGALASSPVPGTSS